MLLWIRYSVILCVSCIIFFRRISVASPNVHERNEDITQNLVVLPLPLDHETYGASSNTSSYVYVKLTQSIRLKPFASAKHTHYFPLSLLTLLDKNRGLRSFSASLTQGQWRSTSWGTFSPPGERQDSGGDLTAVIARGSMDTTWEALAQGVGGVLCSAFALASDLQDASYWRVSDLGFRDSLDLALPENSTAHEDMLITARLPVDTLCTENLHSIIKLFVCKANSGFAALFRSASWFARQRYRTVRLGGVREVGGALEMHLAVSAVVHLSTATQLSSFFQRRNGLSAPIDWLDYHIGSRFPAVRLAPCPIPGVARMHMGIPRWHDALIAAADLRDKSAKVFSATAKADFAAGARDKPHIGDTSAITVGFTSNSSLPEIHCTTFLTREGGTTERLEAVYGIRCHNGGSVQRSMRYFGLLPHTLQPLVHTVSLRHSQVPYGDLSGADALKALKMRWLYPDTERGPTQFSFVYSVRPTDTFVVRIRFWKAFLHANMFAFAPERGLLFPGGLFFQHCSAVEARDIQNVFGGSPWDFHEGIHPDSYSNFTLPLNRGSWLIRYTPSHYLTFPFPEINMMFNTAAISTTVFLFFFDSVVKMTVSEYTRKPEKRFISTIVKRGKRLIAHCLRW